jgi:hypothetical protein
MYIAPPSVSACTAVAGACATALTARCRLRQRLNRCRRPLEAGIVSMPNEDKAVEPVQHGDLLAALLRERYRSRPTST